MTTPRSRRGRLAVAAARRPPRLRSPPPAVPTGRRTDTGSETESAATTDGDVGSSRRRDRHHRHHRHRGDTIDRADRTIIPEAPRCGSATRAAAWRSHSVSRANSTTFRTMSSSPRSPAARSSTRPSPPTRSTSASWATRLPSCRTPQGSRPGSSDPRQRRRLEDPRRRTRDRIETLEDLEGKKVAWATGTNQHGFVLRALDSVGLTQKDVEQVTRSPTSPTCSPPSRPTPP